MTLLRPFKALRPQPTLAADISCPPYDVISRQEARQLAQNNPHSFLRVTRSDLEFDDQIDPYSTIIYDQARANWQRLVQDGTFVPEAEEALYLYRLVEEGRTQVGVVGTFAVDEYHAGTIKIHERTRLEKENDRTTHIFSTQLQAEPVYLAFPDSVGINGLINSQTTQPPLYDFVSTDGIRHTLWKCSSSCTGQLVQAFAKLPSLYIADGHHRAKSASRCYDTLKQRGALSPEHPARFLLAVAFPASELTILPYNRIIRNIPETARDIIAILSQIMGQHSTQPTPREKGLVSVYFDHRWLTFTLPPLKPNNASIADRLDVAILQNKILYPIFGIVDPRTDNNIDFVGGSDGIKALEHFVDSGSAQIAFSLHPASMSDLMAIADAGELMPPKSTWFSPKLRSGLFAYSIKKDC